MERKGNRDSLVTRVGNIAKTPAANHNHTGLGRRLTPPLVEVCSMAMNMASPTVAKSRCDTSSIVLLETACAIHHISSFFHGITLWGPSNTGPGSSYSVDKRGLVQGVVKIVAEVAVNVVAHSQA